MTCVRPNRAAEREGYTADDDGSSRETEYVCQLAGAAATGPGRTMPKQIVMVTGTNLNTESILEANKQLRKLRALFG